MITVLSVSIMEICGSGRGIFVLLALFCTTPVNGDYVSHSDPAAKGESKSEATAFTVIVVLGVVVAIQFFVFVLFACKGWDALFGSRSVRTDPESQLANQFPFLPSYEMAMDEVRASQQNISTAPEYPGIDNGVILEIRSLGVTPPTEDQRDTIETIASVNTPRSQSLDDGVVLEIRSSSGDTFFQEGSRIAEEQIETSLPDVSSQTENCNVDKEDELNVRLNIHLNNSMSTGGKRRKDNNGTPKMRNQGEDFAIIWREIRVRSKEKDARCEVQILFPVLSF